MGFAWAEHLSVGNAVIDSDHKNLIVLVNCIEQAILSADRSALASALELLEIYMPIHLRNEETIAESVNFPFAQNKLEHSQSMNEMRYMVKKLEATEGNWPGNLVKMYSRFLNRWIIGHIVENDMRMKAVLQTYPYDFKPK